jgi:predicted O-methyltransferase YrrM
MGMTETTFGSMNYNVLANILKSHGFVQNGFGAEIGVLYGDTSDYLLSEIPHLTLFSIDPYLEYAEADRSQSRMNEFEKRARERLARFGQRSRILKTTSVEAAPFVVDESLDFVFIDALHNYDAVKEDIATWYPKVRSGGLVAGHDWRWDGVGQAVTEFITQHNIKGHFTPIQSDIWFFVKK